ncbi:MAG: agmatine deiminase family protein [Planctomycetota bacterium]
MPAYGSTGVELVGRSTPAADGYRYPAEWEPHESTLMVMPPPNNWRGSGFSMREVRRQWADVANRLAGYEPVLMVVRPDERRHATRLLSREIELVDLPCDDGWARDTGPMVVVNDAGDRRVAGFTFNGWGGKFPPYRDDALLKARLSAHLGLAMYRVDLVLEGGAVAADGEGTLLTTEQCLLHKNRNRAVGRRAVERRLRESLGADKVIWLGKGLEPDPITDGHVDGLAAFARPGTVLLHTTDDRTDVNYPICADAKRRLEAATDAKGRDIEVIGVPLDGDISHLNFYIANGCVLVPVTGERRQDERPLGVLREAFDGRDVVEIDGRLLGEGGGGVHCVTQQVPRA